MGACPPVYLETTSNAANPLISYLVNYVCQLETSDVLLVTPTNGRVATTQETGAASSLGSGSAATSSPTVSTTAQGLGGGTSTSSAAIPTNTQGSGGGGDSFWTRTSGIIAIVGIIVASIIAIVGVYYGYKAYKAFKKERRERRARERRSHLGIALRDRVGSDSTGR